MKIVGGLISIAIGVLIIWKTYYIVVTFGKVGWAEKFFSGGLGGTYTFYKLVGIVLIILSMMYMFGALGVVVSPVSGIFSSLKNK